MQNSKYGKPEFADNQEVSDIQVSLQEANNEALASKNQSLAQSTSGMAEAEADKEVLKHLPQLLEKNYINKLTQNQSQYRDKLLEDVSYDVRVALPKGKAFFGQVVATFNVKEMPAEDRPLFMDFYGIHIENLEINGIKINQTNSSSYQNGTINLSKGGALKQGPNTVKMHFFNEYRHDGFGFHSFLDQVDQQQYIYTKFEPAFCHYVFPTFDQPDLKAKWQLSTVAPRDWSIISNELAMNSTREELDGALKTVVEAS